MMLKLLTRLVLLLLCMVYATAVIPASDRQYNIVMVLWRGVTEAERGFMNYLKNAGVNANFIIRDCANDASKLAGFVTEIKQLRPDLVYTFGTTVTRAIVGTLDNRDPQRHILDIPVVFNIVADPVGARLLASLSSSAGNFTGVSHSVPLSAQINVMQQARPLNKLAVIYNPLERNSQLAVLELKSQAEKLGFTLLEAPLAVTDDNRPDKTSISARITEVARESPDFLYLPSDSFIISQAREVIQASIEQGIVTFSSTEEPIRESGALMGVVSTYYSVGKFAGFKARQILHDSHRPEDIPVETLRQFSVMVNAKTARRLAYFPPVSLLAVADVIQ